MLHLCSAAKDPGTAGELSFARETSPSILGRTLRFAQHDRRRPDPTKFGHARHKGTRQICARPNARSAVRAVHKEARSFFVISTKAEGRAEKSGHEWTTRQIRGQMSRLRCTPLDMTNSAGFPPNRGEPQRGHVLNCHFLSCTLRNAYRSKRLSHAGAAGMMRCEMIAASGDDGFLLDGGCLWT